MANVNQEIDTIRVGGVDYEVSDPHALYGEHDESAPDLTDNPLYESDLLPQIVNDSTKPSAANVPYQLKQEIDQISSDLASKVETASVDGFATGMIYKVSNTRMIIAVYNGGSGTGEGSMRLDLQTTRLAWQIYTNGGWQDIKTLTWD